MELEFISPFPLNVSNFERLSIFHVYLSFLANIFSYLVILERYFTYCDLYSQSLRPGRHFSERKLNRFLEIMKQFEIMHSSIS